MSETFLILKRTEEDTIKNMFCYPCNFPIIYKILIKFKFFRYTFDEYLNIKFYENPSSGSRVGPYRETDGATEWLDTDNSRLSQFLRTRLKMQFSLGVGSIIYRVK
jgi:hypothetical protein